MTGCIRFSPELLKQKGHGGFGGDYFKSCFETRFLHDRYRVGVVVQLYVCGIMGGCQCGVICI